MEEKKVVGKLTINIGDHPLDLDILSSSLDSSYTAFNFDSETQENIDGYSLTIDASELGKNAVRDLEEVSNSLNQLFRVTLKLEDQEFGGNAKIAKNFSIYDVNLNIELHN